MSVFRLILFVLAGGFLVVWWSKRARAADLGSTSEVRVRDARAGYVRLYGRATAIDGHTLRDPVENLECLWFRIETARLEVRRDRDIGSGRTRTTQEWVVIKKASSSRAFDLRDETGSCRVDAGTAQVEVDEYRDTRDGDLRHRVWRICADDALFVIGEFRPVSAAGATGGATSEPCGHIGRGGGQRAFLVSSYAPEYTEDSTRSSALGYLVSSIVAASIFLLTFL